MPTSQIPTEESPLVSNVNERLEDNDSGGPRIHDTVPGGSALDGVALYGSEGE